MKVFNTDEVRAAIAAIDKKFMEDVNRGDAAAEAAAYTDDAILMPPNHSPLEGKQAIEKYLAEIGSQLQASNFQLSILEVDVQGDNPECLEETSRRQLETSPRHLEQQYADSGVVSKKARGKIARSPVVPGAQSLSYRGQA
jgi:ketosteroid isomerase-like protein